MEKGTITIKNSLYGDRHYKAYIKKGLAVYKISTGCWLIGNVAGQCNIYSRKVFTTKKEAVKFRELVFKKVPNFNWCQNEVGFTNAEHDALLKLFKS